MGERVPMGRLVNKPRAEIKIGPRIERRLDSRYIWKVEPAEFLDRLNMGYERKDR